MPTPVAMWIMQYRYRNPKEILSDAKHILAGHYRPAISITLLYFAVNYLIHRIPAILDSFLGTYLRGWISASDANSNIYNLILYLVAALLSVFSSMLLAGIALFFLRLTTDQHTDPSDIYYGFREEPGKVFQICAVIYAPQVLAMVPYQMVSGRYLSHQMWALQQIFLAGGSQEKLQTALQAFGLDPENMLPKMLLCGGLGLLISLYFSLTYGLSLFLMLDFPKYGAREILSRMRKKIQGHRGRLFLLCLRLLPLQILGFLSFGIGFLWVYPLSQECYTLFFLDLMDPRPEPPSFETRV